MGPGQPGGNAQWGGPAGMPPQGHVGQVDVGTTHSSTWKAFGKAWLPFCGIGLIALIVSGSAFSSTVLPVFMEVMKDSQSGIDSSHLLTDMQKDVKFQVTSLFAGIIILLCQVVLITTGRSVHETGSGGLSFKGFGTVLLVFIAVNIALNLLVGIPFLGFFACLTVLFFTYFAAPAAAHGARFVDAFKESYRMATANAGNVALLFLIVAGYFIASFITCFLGTIAFMPFIFLLSVTAYRQAKGLPIAR